MIIGIVAISKNFAIGKNGKLPWHNRDDLQFFKETTTGNAIVMGSNTWRSIGRPLPNRLNIVITRSGNVDSPPNVLKLSSTEEIVELSKFLDRDVFIIGGAKTYEAFADVLDKWIVTHIPETIEDADTFMPENFVDGFEVKKTIWLRPELKVEILQRQ